MPCLANLLTVVACSLGSACSSSESGVLAQPAPDDAAAVSPADAGAVARGDASPDPSCEDAPLPIIADETDGHLSRLYVDAELDSKRVALLFDTGSATTFL